MMDKELVCYEPEHVIPTFDHQSSESLNLFPMSSILLKINTESENSIANYLS